MATNPKPLSPRERERIAELHAQGASRNDIAKALKRSPATITKACAQLGLSFDRSKTKAATAAKVLDAKARRAQLMLDILEDAARLREQLWAPTTIFSFGGKDNTYAERQVPLPPVKDQRDIVNAVSTAINASLRLDDHDRGSDVDEAKSMIDELFEGLSAAWDQYHQDQPEQPSGGTA
ncbi:MAG: helix-turn-helix domain-containing protein [Umezawaea sp.]